MIHDPAARSVAAGDIEAVFLPARGMLCASLKRRGVELLRRVEDLEAAAAKGSTAGIPLLHPWANRLSGPRYTAAGRQVDLDLSSPLLHLDGLGLPMHGVPWALLAWEVTESRQDFLAAKLEWNRSDLLAVFPFNHRLEMTAIIRSEELMIETTLIAASDPVPVSFGFHPYFGIPDLPRDEWRLTLPGMRKVLLDQRGIPTGEEVDSNPLDGPLRDLQFDDGFAVTQERAAFSLSGAGLRITVEFLEGFRYTQIFAPKGKDFVAIEPMTAPANALISGHDLQLAQAGAKFRTAFRIRFEESHA